MTFNSIRKLSNAGGVVEEISPYFLAFLLTLSQPSACQELNTYFINYKASTGFASAFATRSFSKVTTNSYELLNTIEVSVAAQSLMSMKERSRVTLSDSQLIPLSYSMRQTGFKEKLESIEFDWVQSTATISSGKRYRKVKIEGEIFDKLSHQLNIHSYIKQNTNQISFNIIDESRIQKYQYSVLGNEDIETPLGEFPTIKIKRTLPDDTSRSIVFWLSSEWEGVLLKMSQVINGAITVNFEIQEGRINGESVIGK